MRLHGMPLHVCRGWRPSLGPLRASLTQARAHTHTHTRRAWLAMSKEEQDAQLATMTPEQQDAIKAAVEGNRKTVDLPKEQK